ncbi:3757_t:CDS:2 [Entrophospora sp. SA101]|nr:3757_t:CDS:2 [Entrophospora sp. SA101]
MLINELGDIPMASDADCGVEVEAEAFGGLLYAGFDVSVVFGASAFGASVVFGASGAFGVVTWKSRLLTRIFLEDLDLLEHGGTLSSFHRSLTFSPPLHVEAATGSVGKILAFAPTVKRAKLKKQETGLQVFRLINYDDGTIIIRVTRDTLCPETLIRLRVISKDGDVKSVTFGGLPGTPCTLASEIYPLKIDYFLLTYFNCEKSFCNHYGMILSWDGAIVESDINLSDVQLLEPLLLNKRVQSKTVTRYPDATKSKLLRSGNSEKSSTYEFTVEDFELLPIKNGAYAITIAYNLSTNIGNGTIYEVETYIIPPLTSLKNNLTKFTLYKSEDDLQEIRLIGCHDNIVAGTSNSSQSEDACFLEIEKSNKFSWMQLSFSTEGVTNPLATFGNDSFYDTDTKERIYSVMGMSRNNTDNYMVITINTISRYQDHYILLEEYDNGCSKSLLLE